MTITADGRVTEDCKEFSTYYSYFMPTDDVTLYSDSIVNGNICVEFESADANYIVLVAK